MKISPKTKVQLRAGIAMTAFALAVSMLANAPFDMPQEKEQPVSAATVQKPAQPR